MKKPTGGIILSLLCVTAILTTGFASRFKSDASEVPPASVRVQGTVNELKDGYLSVTQKTGEMAGQELNIYVSGETKILDAVSGIPQGSDSLKKGDTIDAYISPQMTLSLPPMASGYVILTGTADGVPAPEYVTVNEVSVNADGLSGTLTADNGKTYAIAADCQVLPYLTRNIIRLPDISRGQKCLVWTQDGGLTASRIIAFAHETPAGWAEEDGVWRYYGADGKAHKGWLLLNGDWYYLNPESGIMQTGFVTLEGKTYYLKENGKMLTSARTFTPDKNGALH